VEGAAMGNAIIQGIAMGKIKDIQAGRTLVRNSCQVKKYKPGGAISGIPDRYSLYIKLKK